jgi:hypothetical protein
VRKIRRAIGLVFAAALAVGVTAGLAGTANAAATPQLTQPNLTYNEIFFPFLNGIGLRLCVDVPNGSMSSGQELQLFHCHGTASDGGPQRWHFDNSGLPANQYKIFNTNSAKCIGFEGNAAVPGRHLVQEDCSLAPAWTEIDVPNENPFIYLEAVGTSLVMTSASELDNNHNALIAQPIINGPDPAQMISI